MKYRKSASRLFCSIVFLTLTSGCSNSDTSSVLGQLNPSLIVPGTYNSERCFLNKLETLAAGQNRFSTATLIFNADLTGSGHFTTFSDATCTALLSDTTFNLSNVAETTIGGVGVISFLQTGTVLNPTWWIPALLSSTGYLFDVDFTDGESGPYITQPTPAQVSSFGQNSAQGVPFRRQ